MKIELWAHCESFEPAWRQAELAWIAAYERHLAGMGAAVKRGHTLAGEPDPEAVVHLFGSGHFETLHWLRQRCRRVWLSPAPFTEKHLRLTPPRRGILTKPLRWFRRGSASSGLDDLSCLAIPSLVLAPPWAVPEISRWGIERARIRVLSAPDSLPPENLAL